ncbi:MAG: hypothetical protein L3J31_07150, partial [Bacteroidales bacterium]|nr:hypothetical protein [Bacteroidales bacterium]
MKTINSTKTIIRAFVFIAFLLPPLLSNSQISYDHDIKLPAEEYGGSAPRDILYVDGHIFVYTFKGILIFDESRNYEGKVKFGPLGRFAPRYPGSRSYIPDARMMAFDPIGHKLYFVAPSLNVLSVSTSALDTVAATVIYTPDSVMGNNLHGYSKLTYDSGKGRLYWLILTQNENYHSWNSFFGVYKKNQNSFTNIYSEFKNGSLIGGDYMELMQTYEFNPANNDFFVSRKKKIDVMEVLVNDNVVLKKRIAVSAGRIGKMILVNDDGIRLLLAFPAKLTYPLDGDTTERIYQINTQNPDIYDSVKAPSKIIADAIYLPGRNHIVTCFSNINDYLYQLDAPGKDVAIYYYNTNDSVFSFSQSLSTQLPDEVDTSDMNLNRPLQLLGKSDSSILLSKKNEIVDITYSSTGQYTSNSKYYAKGSFFGKGVETGQKTFIINTVNAGLEYFLSGFHGTLSTAYPAFNIAHNAINRKLYFFNRLSTENTGFYIYNLDNSQVEAFVETPRAIGDLVYNPAQNHILVSEFSKNEGATEGVRVYEGDSGAFVQTLSFYGTNYLGRMFVAPNNKVYVSANVKSDNVPPRLLVLDADAYTLLTTITIGLTEDTTFYNLRSHFCYNPYNNKVYTTFAPYVNNSPPYQTSYHSSSAILGDPTESPLGMEGLLLSIDSENVANTIATNIEKAGELICAVPDSVSDNNSYLGTVFINGTQLHTLDCNTGIVTRQLGISEIVDMDYSPQTNCLYAYSHYLHQIDGLDTNRVVIYKIKENGSFNTIWEKDGFGASITYNKYDGQLYVYYRTDWEMLGQYPAQVFTLDAFADTNAETGSVHLPPKSFMAELA